MTSFVQWCKHADVFTTETNDSTHLFLSGGKLKITAKTFDSFIKAYTKALQNKEDLYIVERVANEINLFIDIDCKKYKSFDYKKLVSNIKSIIPEKTNVYKCSHSDAYHIVYPHIQLEPLKACEMIILLQKKLVANFKYDQTIIENIIDTSVYKTGLRMIGSFKKNDYRCYLPENISQRENITEDNVRNSLIRNCHNTYIQQNHHNIINTNYDLVAKEISRLNKNYNDIKITRIVKKENNVFYVNTYSHFCMNKNGFHDNHVYFVICKNTSKKAGAPTVKIYQKCFCNNNETELRKFGVCSKYKSKDYPFSYKVFNMLISEIK